MRYAGNPIIVYGGGGWKDSQVQEPIVFVDPSDATKLIMFFAAMSAPVATGHESIGRATATVASPNTWTEYVGNPILGSASSGNIRLDSMQYVSGTWYLYSTDVINNNINLYTSTDGFNFTPYGGNPVLSPTGQGCTDGTVVSQGAVLKDGATWRMYYSYRNGGIVLPGIRYATSSDGQTWTKQGCADILSVGGPGSTDSTYIEWHQIQKFGSNYILTYEGYNGNNWSENLAYSLTPGSGWAKSLANPIFSPTFVGGDWDQNHVATPGMYLIGAQWWLFYQGTNAGLGSSYGTGHWSLGMASTLDPSTAIP